MKKNLIWLALLPLVALTVFLAHRNRCLNAELEGLREAKPNVPLKAKTNRIAERPRLPLRKPAVRPQISTTTNDESLVAEIVSTKAFDQAFKARVAELKQEREAERERRRERNQSLSPEEREAQRDSFVTRMRERAAQRMKSFASKAGLNAEQTASFENTIASLDTSLREVAESWAQEIRSSKTFSQASKVRFISDMSGVLSAGYSQMDETLPETWKSRDGNVNLMELVGAEALAPVVEALTENGLDEGLQTVGSLMGGPEGGEQGGPGGPGEGGPGEGGPGGPGEGGPGEGGPGGPGGGPGF